MDGLVGAGWTTVTGAGAAASIGTGLLIGAAATMGAGAGSSAGGTICNGASGGWTRAIGAAAAAGWGGVILAGADTTVTGAVVAGNTASGSSGNGELPTSGAAMAAVGESSISLPAAGFWKMSFPLGTHAGLLISGSADGSKEDWPKAGAANKVNMPHNALVRITRRMM